MDLYISKILKSLELGKEIITNKNKKMIFISKIIETNNSKYKSLNVND